VSNSDGRLQQLLDATTWLAGSNLSVDSHDVGFEKPDPRLFHYVVNRLGRRPAAPRHVGDLYHVESSAHAPPRLHAVLLHGGLYRTPIAKGGVVARVDRSAADGLTPQEGQPSGRPTDEWVLPQVAAASLSASTFSGGAVGRVPSRRCSARSATPPARAYAPARLAHRLRCPRNTVFTGSTFPLMNARLRVALASPSSNRSAEAG